MTVTSHANKGVLSYDFSTKTTTFPLISYLQLALPMVKFHVKLVDTKSSSPKLTLMNHSELTSPTAIVLTMAKAFGNEQTKLLLPSYGLITAAVTSYLSNEVLLPTSKTDVNSIINTISSTLAGSSAMYIVPSTSKPTLADVALFFAVLSKVDAIKSSTDSNFISWFNIIQTHVHSVMTSTSPQFVEVGKSSGYVAFEPVKISPSSSPSSAPVNVTVAAPISAAVDGKKSTKPPQAQALTLPNGLTEEQMQASRDKRGADKAKKAAKKPVAAAPAVVEEITVSVLDIRVGRMVKVWEHETADKLFCESIDLGEATGPRSIASGLRPFYKREELEGKLVIVLCNLKSRNLVGFPSHGMVMCCSNDDHTEVQLVLAPEGSVVGERVVCPGFEGDAETDTKIGKKKMFEFVAPSLITNEEGIAEYKGSNGVVSLFTTSAGVCKAERGMKGGHVA